ncbi:hypothetical protein GCM10009677_27600 [Sphaerisporangium rubeum]
MGYRPGFYHSGHMRLQAEQVQSGCAGCRGKGWRFVRAQRVSAELALIGEPVMLRRVACFDCPDVEGQAA